MKNVVDESTLQEQYENHDCHATSEDGCRVCEEYRQHVEDTERWISKLQGYGFTREEALENMNHTCERDESIYIPNAFH